MLVLESYNAMNTYSSEYASDVNMLVNQQGELSEDENENRSFLDQEKRQGSQE